MEEISSIAKFGIRTKIKNRVLTGNVSQAREYESLPIIHGSI